MSFEDVAAVHGQAFGLELKAVQDTTVFEVASDDLVLMSAATLKS